MPCSWQASRETGAQGKKRSAMISLTLNLHVSSSAPPTRLVCKHTATTGRVMSHRSVLSHAAKPFTLPCPAITQERTPAVSMLNLVLTLPHLASPDAWRQ